MEKGAWETFPPCRGSGGNPPVPLVPPPEPQSWAGISAHMQISTQTLPCLQVSTSHPAPGKESCASTSSSPSFGELQ